jgi:hypothetical protein
MRGAKRFKKADLSLTLADLEIQDGQKFKVIIRIMNVSRHKQTKYKKLGPSSGRFVF